MSRQHPVTLVLCLVILLALPGCKSGVSSIPAILGLGGGGDALDEGTVVAGLKEALRIGTERSVEATSRPGGFLDVPELRIQLPEAVQPMARGLRTIGLGGEVDRFEESMNRAAEHAAGQATGVFWTAITEMTVAQAFDILQGSDTAATDYFEYRTAVELRAAFEPRVRASMQEVGLYRIYTGLLERYSALPLVDKPELDLEGYITDRTLDGLFGVLAAEERRIREDPAARTTELLRRVFGSQAANQAALPPRPCDAPLIDG